MELKHLDQFIIEAGCVPFTTSDGRQWRMCQPTPDEAASGDSAYRVMYRRVMEDKRLAELAGSEEALRQEARTRGSAAEALYLIPLLLQKPGIANQGPESTGPGAWVRAFDVFDPASLAEFESLAPGLIAEMTQVYFGLIQQAIDQAKKKVSIGFLNRVALCKTLGRWPFSNPPEEGTLAQMLMYEEALHQLKAESTPPSAPTKPRRLRGKSKEDFYRMVREQSRGHQ